jgi:hypothetical protein
MNRSITNAADPLMQPNTFATLNQTNRSIIGNINMDQQTRICRRITFMYANDIHNKDSTSNTSSADNCPNNSTAAAFQYLKQSNVPFPQSAYTIQEFTCGGNNAVVSSSGSAHVPKVVATTPM